MVDLTAGDLDRRIVILAPVVTPDEFNEPVTTYQPLATVWAKRHDVSAAEAFRAQEIGAQLTTRYTVRWSPQIETVDARFRIRYGGRDFNIVGKRAVGRNDWVEIDAVTRAESSQDFEVSSP